jgi:peptidoglycan/xylan/chitin deacetylase (PgdA/CDA1 family)
MVILAFVVAASVTLVVLLTIENNSLREQLEALLHTSPPVTGETPNNLGNYTGGESPYTDEPHTTTAPTYVTELHTTTEPPPQVWPPEPSGEFADLFPDLYAVNAPWAIEHIQDTPYCIYLTFDDGPNHMTGQILKYLQEYEVPATFFVIPRNDRAAILRRIRDEGHAIGVHSYTHALNDIYSSVEAFLDDFYKARNLIYEQTGVLSDIFRFPGGSINDFNTDTREDIIAEMTRRGFVYFDWNVDSLDVQGASVAEMLRDVPLNIEANRENGKRSIVLFHDGGAFTTWVIDDIIEVLQADPVVYNFAVLDVNVPPLQW